jgi:phosphatidylserine/phosphatidylglycerophosphate/cardiolipin synthase-like enzyme
VRNEHLRHALSDAGVTSHDLAAQLAVDPKTVDRWLRLGRVPHRRHREAVARIVRLPEARLWPSTGASPSPSATHELVQLYTHRSELAARFWRSLLESAERCVDLLAYAGLFLPEQTYGFAELLEQRAADGVRIRVLLGDPESEAVLLRGVEEGIGDAVAVKTRNAIQMYRRLSHVELVEVRLHRATLYTSTYRIDEEMIANPHVIGLPGAQSPALHLRRRATSGLFETYAAAYERVWEMAKPAWSEERDGQT